MLRRLAVLLLSLLASFGLADYGVGQAAVASQSLPDDPCDVLTADELTAISKVQVTAVRRLPSIQQVITAQREGCDPDPGEICSFETESPFGAIMIAVPPRSDRSAKHYWVARSEYFEHSPGQRSVSSESGWTPGLLALASSCERRNDLDA